MWRHVQGFQCTEKGRVDDSVHTKEPPKDLPTECGKGGRLKDCESTLFVIVVGEFRLVVHLIRDPTENFVNVYGRRD